MGIVSSLRIRIAWLACVSLCTTAAIGCHVQTTSTSTVVLTEKDNNTERKLTKADKTYLEIRLDVQPATGFTWELANYDKNVLEAKGEPTVEKADATKPGSNEIKVFRFEAKSVGKTDVELHYSARSTRTKPPTRPTK